MTQPIPRPELIDPDRPLRPRGTELRFPDKPEAELLKGALEDTCAYAQQLWDDLDGLRTYLLDSLPPDPRAPGPHATASASPTGPDDDVGWGRWITAYATVTSVLAGPHGDSGFGLGEARREARLRRTAPVLALRADRPTGPPTTQPATHESGDGAGHRPLHTALTVALAVLAWRGLRARRPTDPEPEGATP